MIDTGRLRLPVYEETLDRIVGVLLARDLWKAQQEGGAALMDVTRDPTFVPASKPVEVQILDMRQRRIKMAIVLDEYGGTAGLVTLEDLIEEIVGEIQDEHEMEARPFEETEEGETQFDGAVPVADVNERLGLSLPEEDYDRRSAARSDGCRRSAMRWPYPRALCGWSPWMDGEWPGSRTCPVPPARYQGTRGWRRIRRPSCDRRGPPPLSWRGRRV